MIEHLKRLGTGLAILLAITIPITGIILLLTFYPLVILAPTMVYVAYSLGMGIREE